MAKKSKYEILKSVNSIHFLDHFGKKRGHVIFSMWHFSWPLMGKLIASMQQFRPHKIPLSQKKTSYTNIPTWLNGESIQFLTEMRYLYGIKDTK